MVDKADASDGKLSALKAIWRGIEAADRGVMSYLGAGGSPFLAVDALKHPMKGLQGKVEVMILEIDPDTLDQLQDLTARPISDAAIDAAYTVYDSDERVNGPDDREAFARALRVFVELREGEPL